MSNKEERSIYKINPSSENNPIAILINQIESGYSLQKMSKKDINAEKELELSRAIILTPDYQREYRFTLDDEVRLVESVLLGIPIPPIFLATDEYKGIRVFNVVDGQHRLRALYRFKDNKFKLENLDLLSRLNGKKFSDLSTTMKNDFLDFTLQTIIFKDFPGEEFELEIFSRYNKGTKPLSKQEIRHAVYNSNFNEYVNDFTYSLYKTKKPTDLYEAYNITKTRIQKKKNQEELFTVLSILEYGINPEYNKSLDYSDKYMEEKSKIFKMNKVRCEDNLEKVKEIFNDFNKFIVRLREKVEYPFSKELYGVSSRNYKFQISTAMILSGIFHRLYNNNLDYIKEIETNDNARNVFLEIVSDSLKDSYLEDPNYRGSSTDSSRMKGLVDKIVISLLDQSIIS